MNESTIIICLLILSCILFIFFLWEIINISIDLVSGLSIKSKCDDTSSQIKKYINDIQKTLKPKKRRIKDEIYARGVKHSQIEEFEKFLERYNMHIDDLRKSVNSGKHRKPVKEQPDIWST